MGKESVDPFCPDLGKSFIESMVKLNQLIKQLSTMKRTPLEKSIIREIYKRFPYTQKEVERVYDYLKSFDKTITTLETATAGNFSIDGILTVFRHLDEPKPQVSEEIFLNKELCDSIRELVVKHPLTLHQAINIMEHSKNYARDLEIVGKLTDGGYDKKRIEAIIILINR